MERRYLTNGHSNTTNISFYGYLFIRDGYDNERQQQKKMIFSININGNIVDWCYNLDCQDKQFHKTWIPKLRDIQIITKDLDGLTVSEVKKIILEDIQPDINMVKEHNNKLARARRMGK